MRVAPLFLRLPPLVTTLVPVLALALLPSCAKVDTTHKVETNSVVEVKPIHATIDVNIRVQVERQLEEFFEFEDRPAPDVPPANAPATRPASRP